jgi:hypothetical protein
MDENVLYPLSIVAVSSVATIGAILVVYKVVFRKKVRGLLSSPANQASTGSGSSVDHVDVVGSGEAEGSRNPQARQQEASDDGDETERKSADKDKDETDGEYCRDNTLYDCYTVHRDLFYLFYFSSGNVLFRKRF